MTLNFIQGFSPHYDDIEAPFLLSTVPDLTRTWWEAFCIQLEGEKRWRVYEPRNKEETLPRLSSPNFNQDEIGDPVIDVVLKPGDLLYFPRPWT